MKYFLISLLYLISINTWSIAQSRTDSILSVLDHEIENRNLYYQKKEQTIASLKEQLVHFSNTAIRFDFCDKIYNEYLPYQFDSAFVYAGYSLELARQMEDKSAEAIAGCNLLHCYISAGLFKESCDILTKINISPATNETKSWYYTLCMRLFSDMHEYANETPYQLEYFPQMLQYCDSALLYMEPGTFVYDNMLNNKLRGLDKPEKRLELSEYMFRTYEISPHETARMNYSMGINYKLLGDIDNAIYFLALSAINDTRYAIRETLAKTDLASILYECGDVMRASNYIQVALEEANFYNARHRKMGVNAVLPIVEKHRMEIIEKQKSSLTNLLIVVTLLLLLLALTLFVIYKQVKKLRMAKQSIQNQFEEISLINTKLRESYDKLENTNLELKESNEIKDYYIIQSLYGKSDYLDKVENLLVKLDRKLKTRQYDDIYTLHKEFNIKTERENVFSSFDQAFLKLFPNFLEDYNNFFLPEDQIQLDEEGNLTPELRIFALIRLGVTESERIAKFLNLSVKTIYSYKGKVKAKAIVPKEEFEYRIMQIKK